MYIQQRDIFFLVFVGIDDITDILFQIIRILYEFIVNSKLFFVRCTRYLCLHNYNLVDFFNLNHGHAFNFIGTYIIKVKLLQLSLYNII